MPPRTNRSALPFGAFHEGGSSGPYDDGADRTDSVFSWADLTNGPTANSTARIRAWARLLSSVGINSLAPQDVNWFEPSNFMKHLPEVNTLGTILRAYAIRLFWTPNYLLAPQQEVADALWRAVPDFGGYLLKVGSEGQGGIATPENINAIAAVLRRAPGSGQVRFIQQC
jgi:alpha-glucuronidase